MKILLHVLVLPDFDLLETLAFVEPFRVAHQIGHCESLDWSFVSETGEFVTASNGITVPTRALYEIREQTPTLLVISSGWTLPDAISGEVRSTIRLAARRGGRVVALGLAVMVLAHIGVLQERRAASPRMCRATLAETSARTAFSDNLYVTDGPCVTCCGGLAAADTAFALLKDLVGEDCVEAVSARLFASSPRARTALQPVPGSGRPAKILPNVVDKALALMEANIERTLSMSSLSAALGVSQRQLGRLFVQYLNKAPALYYRDMRLQHAQDLVQTTRRSMSDISKAAGFSSQVHFSRVYKERFGLPPSKDRKEAQRIGDSA